MQNYDVVLFASSVSTVKSFGAHKIAHELRLVGYTVFVVDYLESFTHEEVLEIIEATVGPSTLFVGVSNTFIGYQQKTNTRRVQQNITFNPNVFFPFSEESERELVDTIKLINPKCKTVIGGTRVYPNFSNRRVNYGVIGFADKSVVDLANHLKHGTPLSTRNYKNIYGTIILDDPAADGFEFNKSTMEWTADDNVVHGEVLPLELSRGCIFACKFCNFRFNGKQVVDYIKPTETLYAELMENYERYGVTRYRILDDTFNDTEEKIDAMLDVVKRLPFQPAFSGYARLDLLTAKPHTIQKIIDLGFRSMFFGIETFNRESGRVIGKGGDPDRMIETMRDMKREYGDHISLTGSFICGLPRETKESVRSTMDRLISGEVPLDFVAFYPLWIGRKTTEKWNSEFNLDLEKFGYSEIRDEGPMPVINWKNEHMTFKEAIEMTSKFAAEYDQVRRPNNPTDALLLNPKDHFNTYKPQFFNNLRSK